MDQAQYLKAKRRLSRRSTRRLERTSPFLMGLAWSAPFPALILGYFLVATAVEGSMPTGWWLFGILVASLLFWLLMSTAFTDACRNEQKWIAGARVVTADYEKSQSRRDTGSTSRDGYVSKSKRQMDHEWYGDHNGLTWQDREQAQAWGMDADTYVSNCLESD